MTVWFSCVVFKKSSFDTSCAAPIVKGYFVVPTESTFQLYTPQSVSFIFYTVFDDSGCPHTLEQCVYPPDFG
jgi:hypothetical protein